jgi:predicted amidohydrolase YtcJ
MTTRTLHRSALYLLTAAVLTACVSGPEPTTQKTSANPVELSPATVYLDGDILTMKGSEPQYAEALVVRDGKIVYVGSKPEALKAAGDSATTVDLGGKTLLPGFIDAHGHIADYVGLWGQVDLSPPPVGDTKSIADIQRKLRGALATNPPQSGEFLFANGYDDSLLAEGRHPLRADLDAVSTTVPISIRHASGHLLSANSKALEVLGLGKDTKDPDGGHMRRDPKTGELTGVMEEQALMPFVIRMPQPEPAEWSRRFLEVQKMWASYGLTTAQDGLSQPSVVIGIRRADADGKGLIDVVMYPMSLLFDKVLKGEQKLDGVEYFAPGSTLSNMGRETPPAGLPASATLADPGTAKVPVGVYVGHSKIQGIKIPLDGSPQGKTAYLSQPYKVPPTGQDAHYRAYPMMPQADIDAWADAAYKHKIQILVHCNGDAAADMFIEAIRKAQAKYGKPDIRPVMIHAQTVRQDQVDAMKELGIIPSFFSAHTFFWGDWHVNETLGAERAAHISPMAYAWKQGMVFTNHNDSPVVPPDMMRLVWTAVNRVSRSGQVIGADERVSPYVALKTITDYAAYGYFEEGSKGTLEAGKRADLVILDRNPLKVDPMTIKDIKVLETLKDGRTVHRAGL